ncbi:cbb3-type cytochrome oxidase assembly protein CcoS [Noviherbaspirillum autotrophicum]|uniref:Cytochrome oxidase maturation protein Cbb3 n=1 Tax=Noviherbaspirillum autotrophicum TaxID=709839 RepID=A0A0C1YLU9_9BURK|nr:hypothetical protein TSA66_12725 [Noviherbaspirillum autotrophicum]
MEALYILVPLSVVLVFVAIWVFLSMSDGGQFDDMVGPAMRVVLDDDQAGEDAPEAGKAHGGSDAKGATHKHNTDSLN